MIVHQAYFGDVEGSHDVIAKSLEDDTLIGALQPYTDISANVNTERPYLSGRLYGNYYVFTRTMRDEEAVRQGMCFSHSLIISKNDIISLENLAEIIVHLRSSPEKIIETLQPLTINSQLDSKTEKPLSNDALTAQILQESQAAIYIGYDDFEENIAYLWEHLPKSLRANFSFTTFAVPDELEEENYTIIHVPEDNKIRWSNYALVNKNTIFAKELSPVHNLITGSDHNEKREFTTFLKENGFEYNNLNELSKVGNCYLLIRKVRVDKDLLTSKRVIERLNHLLPSKTAGQELKEEIFSYLLLSLANADIKEFNSLRNLYLSSFDIGYSERLQTAIKCWADAYIQMENRFTISQISAVISEAFYGTAIPDWSLTVQNRFKQICQSTDEISVSFLQRIWSEEFDLIGECSEFISDKTEQLFINTLLIDVDKAYFKNIVDFAIAKKWFKLHANTVIKYSDTTAAILSQIKVDKSKDLSDNLELIGRETSEKSFVTAAVNINNSTAHKIAGKFCYENPDLLTSINVLNAKWQAVWYQRFLLSGDIIKGIQDVSGKFYLLLDELVSNKPQCQVHKDLLVELAKEMPDIYAYENRNKVWGKVNTGTKNILLHSTCIHIFENYQNMEFTDLEAEVLDYLADDIFIDKAISSSSYSLSHKINFLDKIGLLTEKHLISVLKKVSYANLLEVQPVVDIIKGNDWGKALQFAYAKRNDSIFLHKVVTSCSYLLSPWDRLFLSKKTYQIPIKDLHQKINEGNLHEVFRALDSINVNDPVYNRIKEEFISGSKGIDLLDLGNRLKTFLNRYR